MFANARGQGKGVVFAKERTLQERHIEITIKVATNKQKKWYIFNPILNQTMVKKTLKIMLKTSSHSKED